MRPTKAVRGGPVSGAADTVRAALESLRSTELDSFTNRVGMSTDALAALARLEAVREAAAQFLDAPRDLSSIDYWAQLRRAVAACEATE